MAFRGMGSVCTSHKRQRRADSYATSSRRKSSCLPTGGGFPAAKPQAPPRSVPQPPRRGLAVATEPDYASKTSSRRVSRPRLAGKLQPFVAYPNSFYLRPGIRRRGLRDHARSPVVTLPALSNLARRRYQFFGFCGLIRCGVSLEKPAQAADQAGIEQNLVVRDELVDSAGKGR